MRASMDELLTKTSRTFALAIPLLPEPTQTATRLAYLLFRVSDTLEDAELWTRDQRVSALEAFARLMTDPRPQHAEELSSHWRTRPPFAEGGCLELLAALPDLLALVTALPAPTRRILFGHALRTAEGMRAAVAGADAEGRLRLVSLEELRHYCYVVAGIVGELLTELFVQATPPLTRVRDRLVKNQIAFGEGLQLVNILKDEAHDASAGRTYLHRDVPGGEVLALARADLVGARAYIAALHEGDAPRGVVGFTTLSADLADATLDRIEKDGAGARVPRATVMQMLARVQQAWGRPRADGLVAED